MMEGLAYAIQHPGIRRLFSDCLFIVYFFTASMAKYHAPYRQLLFLWLLGLALSNFNTDFDNHRLYLWD
jgi:hypothetical protein